MEHYKKLKDFTERVNIEFQQEFADEQLLATELFSLYFEAAEIANQQFVLKRETLELISRTFNTFYAGWNLIVGGLLTQGMILLRDTIECITYVKLFEVDEEFREEWGEGKEFFPRDIQKRLKKNMISLPKQKRFYKIFSQNWAHPSKKGTVSHVTDWYPTGLEHRVLFHFGSVKVTPRTRFIAVAALSLMFGTISFLWTEVFPINKDANHTWYQKLTSAQKKMEMIELKSDKELEIVIKKQYENYQSILSDQYAAMEAEARALFEENQSKESNHPSGGL